MRPTTDRLSYEGEIYVRPVGRGVVLKEHPDHTYLDTWLESWLEQWHGSIVTGGCSERVRIVIERLPAKPS